MYDIKDSGERRTFTTGANRDLAYGKGRFDQLPWRVIRALAIHFERGCLKYGERNWEKGIPVHAYFDSATRHLAAAMDGRTDENHLIAALWNLVCAYETILRIQESSLPDDLYTMPKKITLPDPYQT